MHRMAAHFLVGDVIRFHPDVQKSERRSLHASRARKSQCEREREREERRDPMNECVNVGGRDLQLLIHSGRVTAGWHKCLETAARRNNKQKQNCARKVKEKAEKLDLQSNNRWEHKSLL